MSLLKQDTTRNKQVDKNITELDVNNSKDYEVEAMCDSTVYANESESDYLPGFYYLIA